MRNTRSLRRPALVAAAVVATVTLAVCGTTEAGGDATRASGPAAPEFTLQTLEGDTFTLADHLGDVVVLEFLAPGCASCTVDLAGLAKAAEEKRTPPCWLPTSAAPTQTPCVTTTETSSM